MHLCRHVHWLYILYDLILMFPFLTVSVTGFVSKVHKQTQERGGGLKTEIGMGRWGKAWDLLHHWGWVWCSMLVAGMGKGMLSLSQVGDQLSLRGKGIWWWTTQHLEGHPQGWEVVAFSPYRRARNGWSPPQPGSKQVPASAALAPCLHLPINIKKLISFCLPWQDKALFMRQ